MRSITKVLLIGLLFIVTTSIYGQNNQGGLIDFKPKETNGFLVINDNMYPTVTNWTIDIMDRSSNGNQNSNFSYNIVQTYNLSNSYYLNIPKHYVSSDHYLKVTGRDNGNNILVEQGPFGIGGDYEIWEDQCSWTCIGGDYAYKIRLSTNEWNSAFKLRLSSASSSIDPVVIPYYQYMSETAFLAGGSSGQKDHHNVPCWSHDCAGIGNQIIRLTDVGVGGGSPLYDISNTALTGVVYGVQKAWGFWGGAPLSTPELIGGSGHCTQTIGWAVNTINTYSTEFGSRPSLACGTAPTYYGNSNGGGITGTNNVGVMAPSLIANIWDDIFNGGVLTAAELLELIRENQTNQNGEFWPENIKNMYIKPYNANIGTINISPSDFNDANGYFTSPNLTVQPGLNVLGVQMSDNSFASIFFDGGATGSTTSISFSELIDINIYSVPVTGNSFSINLSSQAKVDIVYELYDFFGNLIYTKNIKLNEGESLTEVVTPSVALPSGLLINKFKFSDNSIITKTIMN